MPYLLDAARVSVWLHHDYCITATFQSYNPVAIESLIPRLGTRLAIEAVMLYYDSGL